MPGEELEETKAAPLGRVAGSLQTALPGDLIVLDRSGRVLSRAARRVRWAVFGLQFTVGLTFVGALWGGLLHSPIAGVVAGLATGVVLGARFLQKRRAFSHAAGLASAGHFAEARQALEGLRGRPMSPAEQIWCGRFDYLLAWLAGTRDVALERCERMSRARPGDWNIAFDRAQLLAIAGRADDARAALAPTVNAPSGEWFQLHRVSVDLRIGFAAGQVPASYDGARLHRWAREVLLTNRLGRLCVLLAWAFEQRGDPEMCQHLLAEAPSRLVGYSLAEADPPLESWFVQMKSR